MLAPDERSVLLDGLRPDPGYVLDAAVATTFTVDFAAALVPPLAFARQELTRTDDPLAALQAVRQCSDRIDVFHQAGQIAVPVRASRLVAYLEPMLHAVRRPRPGHLFHPKVWFLRYRDPDDGTELYRLLCLTRNLTQDRSWDVVVRLDGARQGRPNAGNRPLVDLIRSLPGRAVTPLLPDRVERIERLAEDARHVAFDFPSDPDPRVVPPQVHDHDMGVPSGLQGWDLRRSHSCVAEGHLNDECTGTSGAAVGEAVGEAVCEAVGALAGGAASAGAAGSSGRDVDGGGGGGRGGRGGPGPGSDRDAGSASSGGEGA